MNIVNLNLYQHPGIEILNLTNITNSETFIYITLYKIIGNKCQPITIDFSTSDIYIIIFSYVDLGNITVLYSNKINIYLKLLLVKIQLKIYLIIQYLIMISLKERQIYM